MIAKHKTKHTHHFIAKHKFIIQNSKTQTKHTKTYSRGTQNETYN